MDARLGVEPYPRGDAEFRDIVHTIARYDLHAVAVPYSMHNPGGCYGIWIAGYPWPVDGDPAGWEW